MTAIHGACDGGKLEIVRLLLENKADLTIKDNDGKLPFELAMEAKHKPICKLMKEMGDPAAQSSSCSIQ